MKILHFCLLFIFISMILGEEFPFVKDCQDIPDAFLLNADDLMLEDTLITQWYQWNIKIYDNSTVYLDENRISDVNDLINGYFFTTKLFDNHLRPYFTPRQVEMRGELFEIKRGFKKHFHHIAASQNYHPASPSYSTGEETEAEEGSGDGTGYPVDIQFPVSSKVCASFCGQEADVCVELTKIAAV